MVTIARRGQKVDAKIMVAVEQLKVPSAGCLKRVLDFTALINLVALGKLHYETVLNIGGSGSMANNMVV
ncbi:MAG: hypothetical protein MUF81_06870 [Verrucomicrobia bacterium]|jgi:hypothetical protein|nr:hypothetical protein [Verrucomicrobiota bacterium]